jgi:hypothetical protein
MYRKYHHVDYFRYNRIRKVYPLFFWRSVMEEIPQALWLLPKRMILPNGKLSGYMAGRKRLVKRLNSWLLDREKTVLDGLNEFDFNVKRPD